MTRFKTITGKELANTSLNINAREGQTIILRASTLTKEYTVLSTAIVVSENSIVYDVILEEKK